MCEIRTVNDFVSGFENLSKDEQKEVIKKLMPKFCQIVMKEKTIFQEMMPRCMEMMKGMDFPMKEMISKMMGKP
jgi:Glu-tRNA(Gln) amidotransferase subunit E-like FAD-binding protein